jgi:hypothetical protein
MKERSMAKKLPNTTDNKDWRAATMARVRELIMKADPAMTEDRKWKKPSNPTGVPVWSHDGIVCTGETYKAVVKLTFAHGASLPDPTGLFNASLEGNTRRAIDLHEGEMVNATAFKALIKAAVAHNARPTRITRPPLKKDERGVVLLSGGNPQIAKGYGNEPVDAYLDALPGWKQNVGRRLDAIITRTIPNVYKAVKWNTPLYGFDGQSWFLGFHCITKYIKVSFFRGTSLRPMPPEESKQKEVRYFHVHEDEQIDEAQFARWVLQASELPGVKM